MYDNSTRGIKIVLDNSGPHSAMNGSLHAKHLGLSHFRDPTNPQRTTLTKGEQHGKEGRMCEM